MTILYFFSAANRIKIGITKNLAERTAALTRQNGPDLYLIGTMDGSWHLERHIHRMLASHRLHGEWFTDNQAVRNVIRLALAKGPSSLGFVGPKPKKVFVPGPPLPFNITLGKLTELMWPENPIRNLAEFTEQPENVCLEWVAGTKNMPRLLRMAFASELLSWIAKNEAIPTISKAENL